MRVIPASEATRAVREMRKKAREAEEDAVRLRKMLPCDPEVLRKPGAYQLVWEVTEEETDEARVLRGLAERRSGSGGPSLLGYR